MKREFVTKVLAAILALALSVTLTCPVLDAQAKGKSKKQKEYTISNVKAADAIEADVRLLGDGVGSHAKLVLVSPKSGVSVGIQYDRGAREPYAGKAMLLVENIRHNNEGGQRYYWPLPTELHMGKYYHLMLSLSRKGDIGVYFNRRKVASYKNKDLAGREVSPRVEASAKYNGDVVDADFKNIRIKDGSIKDIDIYDAFRIDTAKQIKSRIRNNSHVSIYGHLTGLKNGQDWDSAYEAVSGIVQYNLQWEWGY